MTVTVSIAETERLWLRFQQLGCNEDGEITETIAAKLAIQNDAFARNVSTVHTYTPVLADCGQSHLSIMLYITEF